MNLYNEEKIQHTYKKTKKENIIQGTFLNEMDCSFIVESFSILF